MWRTFSGVRGRVPRLFAPDGGSGRAPVSGLSLASGSRELNIGSVSLLWVNKPRAASPQPIEKGCSPPGRGKGWVNLGNQLLTDSKQLGLWIRRPTPPFGRGFDGELSRTAHVEALRAPLRGRGRAEENRTRKP
jgi:hypothetical protein